MDRLGSSGSSRGVHVHRVGGLGAVLAVFTVIAVALLAMITLGFAMLFMPRRKVAGGVRPGVAPGDGGGDRVAAGGAGQQIPLAEPLPEKDATTAPKRERSYAEVLEAWPIAVLLAGALTLGAPAPATAKTLVPMDDKQTDHLKAYGLTYWVLG